MPTIRQIKLIRKKKFAIAIFDPKNEIFMIYIAFFNLNSGIHLFYKAQIALLKIDKALITILFEYINFANIFFLDLIM